MLVTLLIPSSPDFGASQHLCHCPFILSLQQFQSLLPLPSSSSFANVLPKAAELAQDPCLFLVSRMTFRGTLGTLPKELAVAWGLDLSSLVGSSWSSMLSGAPEFSQQALQGVLSHCVALLPSQICAFLAQPECTWGMCWAWLETFMAKILQHHHLYICSLLWIAQITQHPSQLTNVIFADCYTALLINKYTRINFS